MTSQAFGIVETRLVLGIPMGIMAGDATDPAVAGAEAAAFGQPVGLKTDSQGSLHMKFFHVRSGAVAGATELYKVSGPQGGGIEDMKLLQTPRFHRRHVLGPWPVAAFACDSCNQPIELEAAVAHGTRG